MTAQPSVILPVGVWVDLYMLAGIPFGEKMVVHNVGSSDVYLITAAEQPDKDADSYQVIQPSNIQLVNEHSSPGEWAFSPNQQGKINVRPVYGQTGWSQYVEGRKVTPAAGVTDETQYKAQLLDSLNSIETQLRLLNARFEELGETQITERDIHDHH